MLEFHHVYLLFARNAGQCFFRCYVWLFRGNTSFFQGESFICVLVSRCLMLSDLNLQGQQTTTTIPPNEDQRQFFVIFTSLAFAFKVNVAVCKN